MKNYPKIYNNDIKVLGRVVSIATENKVAAAEQVFDEKFNYLNLDDYSWDNIDLTQTGQDQYTINRLVSKKLKRLDDAFQFDEDGWVVELKVRNLFADNAEIKNLHVTQNSQFDGNVNIAGDIIVKNTNILQRIEQISKTISGEDKTSTIWQKINELENRILVLENCCEEMHNNPTGVSLNVQPDPINAKVGDPDVSFTVTPSIPLAGNYTATISEGSSHASLVNGKVHAISEGTAKLSIDWSGIKKTVTINVTAADPVITKYTLTYKDGSTILGTQQYEASATVTPITSPTKDGYTFAGWDGMPADFIMPAHDLTVTAKWTENQTPETHIYDFSVNPATKEVPVNGYPFTITAIPTDNGSRMYGETITWTTTNSSVVTVDNGSVTIVGEGTAEITATWIDPNGVEHTATCNVTIGPASQEEPTKTWEWEENPMTVRVGETIYGTVVHDGYDVDAAEFQIQYPVVSGNADGVISIDLSYPTVHANEYNRNFQIPITGLDVGTQKIRAKISGRDDIYEDLTVNVIAPVATLTISGPDTIAVGGEAEYGTTISIEGGSNAANWSNGSPSIIDFVEGAAQSVLVTGSQEGTATITATSVNYPGIVATKTITVVAAGEAPQTEYTIEVRPLTSNVTANGDPAHILFYVKPDAEIDPETGYEKNRYWTFFVPEAGVSGIHGESLNEGRIDIDPADDANDPTGITYHVYGIIASQDELSANNINWETWTLEDWNNTTLPKASNQFTVTTYGTGGEEPVEPVRNVTFVYDPSTSNDTKIMSVDGSSKEDFTFENNGGYRHVLMYGSSYGRTDNTTVPTNGSRTYTITIDDGYRITGIDPNFQYNTITRPEEDARLDSHISYTISADGKSMTITINDIATRNGEQYSLNDDCNGYLDIVILYEVDGNGGSEEPQEPETHEQITPHTIQVSYSDDISNGNKIISYGEFAADSPVWKYQSNTNSYHIGTQVEDGGSLTRTLGIAEGYKFTGIEVSTGSEASNATINNVVSNDGKTITLDVSNVHGSITFIISYEAV